MEDQIYNELRTIIQDEVKYWVDHLGLQSWTVDLIFQREGFDSNEQDGDKFYARTAALWEYMSMSIDWDMPMCLKLLKSGGKEGLTNTVVHELMHGVVNEMHELGSRKREPSDSDIKHEERVVTCLTNCFMVYKAHRDREIKELSDKAGRSPANRTGSSRKAAKSKVSRRPKA